MQAYITLKKNLSEVWIKSGLAHTLGLNKVGILLPNILPDKKSMLDLSLEQLQKVELGIAEKEKEAAILKNARLEAESKLAQVRAQTAEANSTLEQLKTSAHQRLDQLHKIRQKIASKKKTIEELRTEILSQLHFWPDINTLIDYKPEKLLSTMNIALEVWAQKDKTETEQNQLIHRYVFENNQINEELSRLDKEYELLYQKHQKHKRRSLTDAKQTPATLRWSEYK